MTDFRFYASEYIRIGCYDPLSCKFYKEGTVRKVPGRNGMIYEEADWIDEEATRHREMDE